MDTMTKKRSTSKPTSVRETKPESEEIWKLFTKIDGSLKTPFEDYLASLEYPTDQARVIEKMFKEFLEKRGFWPPKKKAAES